MKEGINNIMAENLESAGTESLAELMPDSIQPQLSEITEDDTLRQEAADWRDRCMRQAAELDNYKKRNEREKADSIRRANEHLMKDLLPVLDNLERALDNPGDGMEGSSFYKGVKMIRADLDKILGKHGLEALEVLGIPFDPNNQEAIMQQADDTVAENTVIGQMQSGYVFQGRLLRPALVTVSKKG